MQPSVIPFVFKTTCMHTIYPSKSTSATQTLFTYILSLSSLVSPYTAYPVFPCPNQRNTLWSILPANLFPFQPSNTPSSLTLPIRVTPIVQYSLIFLTYSLHHIPLNSLISSHIGPRVFEMVNSSNNLPPTLTFIWPHPHTLALHNFTFTYIIHSLEIPFTLSNLLWQTHMTLYIYIIIRYHYFLPPSRPCQIDYEHTITQHSHMFKHIKKNITTQLMKNITWLKFNLEANDISCKHKMFINKYN